MWINVFSEGQNKTKNKSSSLTIEASILGNTLHGVIGALAAASNRTKFITATAVVAVIMGLGSFASNFNFPPGANVMADSGTKIVSLYYDGQKRVVTTDAVTVGDLLQRANVALAQGDRVEPSADTKIPDGYFNINVYRGTLYRIIDGGTATLVKSAQDTPRLIAADAGITIYPEDTVSAQPVNDFVDDHVVGQNIIVDRATPVTIEADGQSTVVRTHTTTVAEVLDEKGITLGQEDTVSPGLDATLSAGMTVTITRVNIIVATKDEVIPMKVVQQTDANMLVGTTRVDSQGKDGEQLVTYRITYQNGQIVDQVALQTEKVSSAVARVVTTGTRVLFANDIVQMASDMAAANGWTGDEWTALYSLWNHESGFNPNAVNSSSGACGIPQAKPCGGLSSYTVEGQISWGLNYITNRYGDPVNAWNHEQKYGWY